MAILNKISKKVVSDRFRLISEFFPEEYAREPEDLENFDNFKATEFKQILLIFVHGLLHLTQDARIHGNLEDFSAFPFENALGTVSDLATKRGAPLHSIANRLQEMAKNPNGEFACLKTFTASR